MKFNLKVCLLSLLVLTTAALYAQQPEIYNDDPMQQRALNIPESEYVLRQPTGAESVTGRIEPPNWWVGMENPRLQLLIHEKGVAKYTEATTAYPGVTVEYVTQDANPNYLFVGLNVGPGVQPGPLQLRLTHHGPAGKKLVRTIPYELSPHPRKYWDQREQLSAKDLIYLIMPDRFANGDVTNDVITGTHDTLVNRRKFFFRHGGDLQGVIDRLGYLEDLGVTALWLNPVLENNQPYASYHGYAVTDHYRIDRRFGTNEKYRELVEKAHDRGIKVIMDVIFNHVGDQHYLMRDLPGTDWIHQWPEFTKTTYRAPTLMDPNASMTDRQLMTDGWFDKHMPDLNQRNEHVANYLIQNSLWWTLWSGQDAFRIDTYAYADAEFTAEWNRRLLEEIPHLGIFGETWVNGPGVQAWFADGRGIHQNFDSHLPGVTDFQLYYAIHEAMGQDPGWKEGVNRIYYTLAQDYLYENPAKNVIFLDNHDIARLFTTLGQDLPKLKSTLALLLTMRGIPMLYYGTEVGLTGAGGAFGEGGRVDFPGGWQGDEIDLFDAAQRDETQVELHGFVRRLAGYRKSSKALTAGKMTQFVPRNGVYFYFRHQGDETVMVAFNGNNEAVMLDDLSVLSEMTGGYTRGHDLTRDVTEVPLTGLDLKAKEVRVIVLK